MVNFSGETFIRVENLTFSDTALASVRESANFDIEQMVATLDTAATSRIASSDVYLCNLILGSYILYAHIRAQSKRCHLVGFS